MMPTEGLASCHELLRDTEDACLVPADDLSPSLAGFDVIRVRCANV